MRLIGTKNTASMTLTAADLKKTLTLKVKISRMLPVRHWLLVRLLKFACFVGGVGIEIETSTEKKDVTPSRT